MIQAVISRSVSAEDKIQSQTGSCENFGGFAGTGMGTPQVLLLYWCHSITVIK